MTPHPFYSQSSKNILQDRSSAANIYFLTLGCAKNEVDTDVMKCLVTQAGYKVVDAIQDADLAIINTCSFLSSATEESIVATLELAGDMQEAPIIMTGCVPSRYFDDLPKELPEVKAFVRAQDEHTIVSVIDNVLDLTGNKYSFSPCDIAPRYDTHTTSYVKISDGCSRFCSFCAIPFIRGRYKSRSEEEIISEVSYLLKRGVKELVLIGQDTGVWGLDFKNKSSLATLLRRLSEVIKPYHAWIRVLYLQPEGLTDDLIDVFKTIPEVLPYIDIPIQHCNERLLKAMGRSGSEQELRNLFDRLKREIPSMVLRTTAMTAFPSETDAESDELANFIEDVGFDYCSVFIYSPEEGTRAYNMKGRIPKHIALERAQKLQDLAEQLGFASTSKHVGETVDVIVDSYEHDEDTKEFIGHAWFQAPDSDGAVHIPYSKDIACGDIIKVELKDAFCYELIGEVVP